MVLEFGIKTLQWKCRDVECEDAEQTGRIMANNSLKWCVQKYEFYNK